MRYGNVKVTSDYMLDDADIREAEDAKWSQVYGTITAITAIYIARPKMLSGRRYHRGTDIYCLLPLLFIAVIIVYCYYCLLPLLFIAVIVYCRYGWNH